MSYTLLKECTVVLVYDGMGHQFDALSNFNFNQTYNRSSQTRKTLHSRNAKPNTMVNAKNVADFYMSSYITDTYTESVLFELIGLTKTSNNKFVFPDTTPIEPKTCDIYVVSDKEIFKLSPAVLDSLDIGMSSSDLTELSASFSAGNSTKVDCLPATAGIIRQGRIQPCSPASVMLGRREVSSVVNLGLALQQDITWRNQRSIHGIGTLYTATKPILTGMALGLNIDSYLDSNLTTSENPEIVDIKIYKDNIYIKISDSLITKRIASGEIFTGSYDVSLTEQSKAYVEYGGVTI